MRLTSLTLRNFKAIGCNEQCIEFSPITLLFGPNSAGKSTIVQALHYMAEILIRNNCDPGTTQLGGKLDLGGFLNLVHLHNADATIELSAGITLNDTLLPSYGEDDEEHVLLGEILGTERLFDLSQVESVEVKLGISWSRQLNRAYVSFYSVSVDGEHFATISAKSDQKQIDLSHLNFRHTIFSNSCDEEDNTIKVSDKLQALVDEFTVQPNKDMGQAIFAPLQLLTARGALPAFGRALILFPSNGLLDDAEIVDPSKRLTDEEQRCAERKKNEKAEVEQRFSLLNKYISRIIVGSGELVRDCLQQFLYLGPLREIPGRHFNPERSPGLARWSSGLGAWDQLFNEGEPLANKINTWLSDDNRLNAGYELHYSEFKPLKLDSPLMVALQTDNGLIESPDWVREQLSAIPTLRQITLRDTRTNIDLYPEDLGTGISQVLPVLVATLGHNKNIVAIEQPELHVHPKFQVELGELFIHAINEKHAADNTVFILETHSEYMMLRFLRRLYETVNDELEPGAYAVKPEDVAVYYINPTEEGVKIVHLRLTEEGEFLDRWPNGFFPERKKELF